MTERKIIRIVKGNKKLPQSTFVVNMNSATDCPSAKLGLCEMGCKGDGTCYAIKPEIQYPDCLPARRTDEKVWDASKPADMATILLKASKRARIHKMKEFRFSEAGDFKTQGDIDKMATLCKELKANGVICYGYTARNPLKDPEGPMNFSELMEVASVNGSGFMLTNNFEKFDGVTKTEEDFDEICYGDCNLCNFCYTLEGKNIGVPAH